MWGRASRDVLRVPYECRRVATGPQSPGDPWELTGRAVCGSRVLRDGQHASTAATPAACRPRRGSGHRAHVAGACEDCPRGHASLLKPVPAPSPRGRRLRLQSFRASQTRFSLRWLQAKPPTRSCLRPHLSPSGCHRLLPTPGRLVLTPCAFSTEDPGFPGTPRAADTRDLLIDR